MAETPPTSSAIVDHIRSQVFDRKLLTNNLRGLFVEAMLDLVLRPDWKWCSADYAAWDFERSDGRKVEVKQAAARQSWQPGLAGYSAARFDIRERKFRWEGTVRIEDPGRYADAYVFAYHPIIDDSANHGDASQWQFYVVPTSALPPQKTLGLQGVRTLGKALTLGELKASLNELFV